MDKATAKKLANQIIDYFVKQAGDVRRSEIYLRVTEYDADTDDDKDGSVLSNLSHLIFSVRVNVFPNSTERSIVETVCHELAHIFTWEFEHYKKVFVSLDDDGDQVQDGMFTNYYEKIAYRLQAILTKAWYNRKQNTEGKK